MGHQAATDDVIIEQLRDCRRQLTEALENGCEPREAGTLLADLLETLRQGHQATAAPSRSRSELSERLQSLSKQLREATESPTLARLFIETESALRLVDATLRRPARSADRRPVASPRSRRAS